MHVQHWSSYDHILFLAGTVLANEEIINGLSERGNHPVVKMPIRQWLLKITAYADELEEGLQGLQWPEGEPFSQAAPVVYAIIHCCSHLIPFILNSYMDQLIS
jgi:hypothetical protein